VKWRRYLFAWAWVLTLAVSALATAKDKDEHEGQKVDSGSFGVFMGGHRVGTETFSIYQSQNGSVIESEFKTEGAAEQAKQASELRLSGSGEIRRYDWREISPGKSQLTILPSDQAILYLTSGATGEPKMVMVTHEALIRNLDMAPAALELTPDDITLAFLPSAHIAQRIVVELIPIRCANALILVGGSCRFEFTPMKATPWRE